jgi:dTDP-glucose 4,6-dehydratase
MYQNPLAEDLRHILDHTQNLWPEMRGKNLFLTGGTGFFGCWVLESLLAANRSFGADIHACVLTRDPEGFRKSRPHLALDPAITLLAGDVRHFAFPKGEFPVVIHAATDTWSRQTTGGAPGLLGAILGGTERVLQFAASHGTEKLLLTSSGAVYGAQPAEITHIPEDYAGAPSPLRVDAGYAEGKRAAEALCAAYSSHYGFASMVARCFAFVGPLLRLDKHFAIGNFIGNVLRRQPITIQGDGTPERSYLYASDLVIWLWTILMRGESLRAYNVGSGQAVSILELARAVAEVLEPSTPIEVLKQARC